MPMFNPPHPGAGIREYMGDTISISELARHLHMTRANLSMILNGRLGVSASVAIKLGEAFPNTDARFWMALQSNYDISRARRKKRRKIAPLFEQQQNLQKAA